MELPKGKVPLAKLFPKPGLTTRIGCTLRGTPGAGARWVQRHPEGACDCFQVIAYAALLATCDPAVVGPCGFAIRMAAKWAARNWAARE